MKISIIVLDADGALADYQNAYSKAWAKAFGQPPAMNDVQAYWPWGRWAVERLSGKELNEFKAVFDDVFWSTIPAIHGAVQACCKLSEVGYELICVSALKSKFSDARRRNLEELGVPIETMIATGNDAAEISPKEVAVRQLNPVAFVDGFLPHFRGVPNSVLKALVRRAENGSPNVGAELNSNSSRRLNLAAFVEHWLKDSKR